MSMKKFLENCERESLEIFRKHSENDHVTFTENFNIETSEIIPWNSFIFLGGSKFRLMFETEFSTIMILSIASEKFSDVQESEYIDQVKDFMREFCNLVAGKVKAAFEKETDALLSLPIISRDYNVEKLFGVEESKVHQHKWSIGENNMNIKVNLYYYEKKNFENYDVINEHLELKNSNDSIDFF